MDTYIEIEQGTLPLPEALSWFYDEVADRDRCAGHLISARWNVTLSDMCWLNAPEEDEEDDLFMNPPASGWTILKK